MIPGLVPIGSIIAWAKSFTGVASLATQGRTEYVECNGQTLSDTQSPLNGNVFPNLNNSGGASTNRYLRGATTSGGTGGSDNSPSSQSTSSASASLSTGTTTVEGNAVVTPVSVLSSVVDTGHSHAITQFSILNSYYSVVWIMRVK